MVVINQEGAIIDMFIKKFRRKCDVRGCKNTMNVYLLSKRREFGNTVAICRDCLEKALAQTDNYIEAKKVKREPQPLFPHPELNVTLSSVADTEPEPVEVIEEATEDVPISVAEDTVTVARELDKLTDAELRNLGMHRDDKGEQGEIGLPNITKTTTKPKTTSNNNKKKPNKKK